MRTAVALVLWGPVLSGLTNAGGTVLPDIVRGPTRGSIGGFDLA